MKNHIAAFTMALAASGVAITPTIASAAEQDQRQASVTYGDLDLSDGADLEKLDRRITRAARQVCGYNERATGTRLPSRAATACVEDAKRSLNRQFAGMIEEANYGG